MSPDSVGPLSRPFPVARVTPDGVGQEVVADAEERAALARDLGLVAIHDLRGRFRLSGEGARLRVAGTVTAEIEQTCVVSLEPFRSDVEEAVEVEFRAPDPRARRQAEPLDLDPDEDGPDELLGDHVDLGAITAEFLALGLDPHPRKPGIAFEPPEPETSADDSPFARLAALRPKDEP